MSNVDWNDERRQYLRDHYATAPREQLLRAIPASWVAIRLAARRLGLVRPRPQRHKTPKPQRAPSARWWSAERIELLRTHYPAAPWPDLIELLGATPQSIAAQARRYGVSRESFWTAERLDHLRANYATAPRQDLLAALPTTWRGICDAARGIGLSRPYGGRPRTPKPAKASRVRRASAVRPPMDTTPLGERHARSLASVEAWRAANAAVSRRLDLDVRADVIADMLVAHYAGELPIASFTAAAEDYRRTHARAAANHKLVPLDARRGDAELALADLISNDDYAERWDALTGRPSWQDGEAA